MLPGQREVLADVGAIDCWPGKHQRLNYHPYHDAKRIAAEVEEQQDALRDFFLPQYTALGAERDDPGALSIYERHRAIERQIAEYLYYEVAPYAEAAQRLDLANKIRGAALKMFGCRTSGLIGMGLHGKPVIAWDDKCSCSKLCPDESRHEAQRLYDRYAQVIADHAKAGGRVYKVWPTLPNYPVGRLREGKRHIFKRFRDKIVRAQAGKKNRFGHVGSLVIQEDPLSKNDDWNVHLNGIILTSSWLSYRDLRKAWGRNIEMRQHSRFDSKGLHGLFNEMIKYPVRAVPEKSITKHHTEAPAFTTWSPAMALEWYQANHGFRRTRAYGSLHGIGKPERPNVTPRNWIGRLDWRPEGYLVTWRAHNLGDLVKGMLTWDRATLDLIRGDRSTTEARYRCATGPP